MWLHCSHCVLTANPKSLSADRDIQSRFIFRDHTALFSIPTRALHKNAQPYKLVCAHKLFLANNLAQKRFQLQQSDQTLKRFLYGSNVSSTVLLFHILILAVQCIIVSNAINHSFSEKMAVDLLTCWHVNWAHCTFTLNWTINLALSVLNHCRPHDWWHLFNCFEGKSRNFGAIPS